MWKREKAPNDKASCQMQQDMTSTGWHEGRCVARWLINGAPMFFRLSFGYENE